MHPITNGILSYHMQIQKSDIRKELVKAAEELFLQKGFQKTSMREIADATQVGLGNIYNYFQGKDELFCTILRPVTSAFEQMLDSHHGHCGTDIMEMCTETYLRHSVNEYISFIRRHRDLMTLLLFRTRGSSLENFREDFTDRSTQLVKGWLADMRHRHPALAMEVSDFFIHLHSVWMFTLFEEIIMHNVADGEINGIVAEYIRFEIIGWRDIMKI